MLGVLLGVLFAFAFGGMMLILFLGARRIEDEFTERAREVQTIRAEAARVPRFFVLARPPSPEIKPVDDMLLWQLQEYLKAEQVLADEFVSQPSIESLYRESSRKLTAH